MVSPLARSVVRLLLVQASWTYERMQGVGIGYATLPLLDPLRSDPRRYAEAVARGAEYFNAHPYLDGIAVGAAARAEIDGVAPGTIQRLKTALAGPLGSLGDQLFWIGVVPAIMAAVVIAVALGAEWPAVALGVASYLGIRLYVTAWGARLGFGAGVGVAAALKQSGLADQVRRVGMAAGFLIGAAVPLAAQWYARTTGLAPTAAAFAAGATAGIAAALVRFRVPSARQLTLLAMGAVVLWHWSA